MIRTFQGVANHQDGDFIFVSEWHGHKQDLFSGADKEPDVWVNKTFAGSFGGMLGLPEILLDTEHWVGMMCARWGETCTRIVKCKHRSNGTCNPPRVKFRAIVEVEKIDTSKEKAT